MGKLFCLLFLLLLILPSFASSLSVVVHVPEKYTDVSAGDRFYFAVEVKYPENPRRKDLRLEYTIITIDGELIAQSKALKAVETQASFIDFIVIPESTDSGLYLVNVEIKDYEILSEEVSSSFNIVGNKDDELKLYFMIMIGVVLFLAILVLFQIFRGRKKR
ncbi:MAG: hypothetical protein PF542_02070 [Nanoarchaeota archaeon]|jgi:hypothetical protein|nr:hypothetical protein [Nanoarchaeota archaeon]